MDSSGDATSHKRSATSFSCNICKLCAFNPVTTTCGHVYCRPCLHTWLDRCRRGFCPVCRAVVSTDANVISIRLNSTVELADQPLPHDISHVEHPEIQASDTRERLPGFPETQIDVLQDEHGQILSPSLANHVGMDDEDLLLVAEAPEIDEDPDLDDLVRLLIGGGC